MAADRRDEMAAEAREPNELLRDALLEHLDQDDDEAVREVFDLTHPADFADALELLPDVKLAEVVRALDIEDAADLFEELEPEHLAAASDQLPDEHLADVLDQMPSDEAADFIGELHPTRARELLGLMERAESADVEDLLAYATDTAGGIMQAEVIGLNGALTADETVARIRSLHLDPDHPYYLYVISDAGHLIGVLSFRQLLSAPGDTPIRDVMTTTLITARSEEDQEEVAQRMRKYDLLALPVVGEDGLLLGVVTADDVMDVIEDELEEDLYRFAGASIQTQRSPWRAAVSRLPVVLVCMIGDIFAGQAVLKFEPRIENLAALAAFLPAMMATGGNIGQQSLAKMLRNITSGDRVTPALWRALLRESAIGITMGVSSGVLLGGIAMAVLPSFGWSLLCLLAVALTLSSLVAAILGTAVPLALHRLQRDPAIASGPLITTLNDIISTTIYFALAVRMMHLLEG